MEAIRPKKLAQEILKSEVQEVCTESMKARSRLEAHRNSPTQKPSLKSGERESDDPEDDPALAEHFLWMEHDLAMM
nr:MAG TPA: hypothetical protein [Caudoviricetes sp.]